MNAPEYIQPEQLLSVLSQSPNATAVYIGADIRISSANKAMLDFWGKDKNIIGQSFSTALPELLGQPFFDILKQVWNSGKTYIAKDYPTIIEKDGRATNLYFDFEYKPILDERGNTAYILHTAFEVSERMEAKNLVKEKLNVEKKLSEDLSALNEEYHATNDELISINEKLQAVNNELLQFKNNTDILNKTLIESENRFRSLVEHSPVAMASLQGENFIVDVVNDAVLHIWGKDRSVVGVPLHLALPELEGQPFLGILKEVFDSGHAYHAVEMKARLFFNNVLSDRYLNFAYQPIPGEDGKSIAILIVATDVTDHVTSRAAIEEMNTRLQIALDAGNLGSTEVHLETGIMQSTDQFKYHYGYAPEQDFVYSDLFAAILPEHRDRVRGLVQEAIKTNGIYKTEYPVKWSDGSLHWIEAHGRPRYDENGVADRMVGMNSDITDKKLFEQRKDDFLSIASHELKTPITSLKASLQLLDRLKNKPFSETHIKLIEQSGKSVEKMMVLVDELLNMSRLSEDQLKLEKSKFNLHQMLSMSCNHIRMEGDYRIILHGDKNIEVYADEHRIDQVIINFVNNSVKYAPQSKEIHIKVETLDKHVKVSVEDFGEGIDEKILPNLFDRYFRVDHSGKTYTGLGLGLYICSEIIRRHEGEIGAESKIGEGSTFWFTIPI